MSLKVQSSAKHPAAQTLGRTLQEPIKIELNAALVDLIQGLPKSRKTAPSRRDSGLSISLIGTHVRLARTVRPPVHRFQVHQ